MIEPYDCQKNWFAILGKYDGDEQKAKQHLIGWLRRAIEQLEKTSFPYVMGCDVPLRNPVEYTLADGEMIETVSVTFSHPWGG